MLNIFPLGHVQYISPLYMVEEVSGDRLRSELQAIHESKQTCVVASISALKSENNLLALIVSLEERIFYFLLFCPRQRSEGNQEEQY